MPADTPVKSALGIHAFVLVPDVEGADWVAACRLASEAGYDLVEVPLLDPAAVDIEELAGALEQFHLTPAASLGLTFETDVSSDDAAVRRAGAQTLSAALERLDALGGTYLGGVLYSAIGKYPAPPTETGRRNAAAALADLADEAADVGVTLGIEPANRYETNLVNTSWQAVDLIERIDRPNVVVHLDAFHVHIEEGDFDVAVRACGDRLGYVHVGECHRGYLGTGSVDFPRVFRSLHAAGYDGPITFESFSDAALAPGPVGTLAVWRPQWTDARDVATRANEYMRAQLAAAAARGFAAPASGDRG